MNSFTNSQIITTLKEFMKTFETDSNLNLNQVTFTSVYNLNAGILNDTTTTNGLKYPLLNTYVETATMSKNTLVIPFEVTYFDRLMKNGSNMVSIWDNGISTLGYILRTLELNHDIIFKNMDTSLELMKYDLDNECAGVKATVEITFDVAWCGRIN